MVLLVGQVARDMKGRDAFQEVDYQAFFGGMAKLVIEIDDANQLPSLMAKAWKTELEGRPGPVVISLPEDMVYDPVQPFSLSPEVMEKQMPDDSALDQLAGMIASAHTPVIIAGGPCWSDQAIASLDELAIKADIPVICSFRRQRLMNHLSPAYAGDLGLGM